MNIHEEGELHFASYIKQVLKEALKLDQKGFSNMILSKHKINKELAEHPDIQTSLVNDSEYGLSGLGLINGFFKYLKIVAIVSDDLIDDFFITPCEAFFSIKDN